ncbi:MAG: DNA polymerase III subunit gamma/tau [Candidatus Omnitrophica bacterium]|nr:DNA polymerase III subunit gamma/tau [Candidatus Omnitrophota bacterium]
MSYIVLARKYRPENFDELIAQEHITGLIKKAITGNRTHHAYLFCGPRGIGKTSCARVLAKALNCKDAPTVKPCGTCSACKEISVGTSFDVLEIDGASNRGIDDIRTLRENVKFAPSYGKYKIYIVDEVHMLTAEAFNALLKTLEEPPECVKFIFATTDPNKVPSTIISRCQKFEFKRIDLKTLIEALKNIAKKEKIKIDEDALYAVAKAAQGSFRDALSVLDQVGAISDRQIKGEDVYAMLGLVEVELLFAFSKALWEKNCAEALSIFDDIISKGKDIKQLSKDLVEHFRNLMIIRVGGKSLGKLVDYPVAIKEMYLEQAENYSLQDILQAIDLFIEAQDVARVTETLRVPIEIAIAKLTYTGEKAMPTESLLAETADFQEATEGAAMEKAETKATLSPAMKLKDKSGKLDIMPDEPEEEGRQEETPAVTVGETAPPVTELNLERFKKAWSALTYAVSKERMSLATYLQEGFPYAYNGEFLTIGFDTEHEYHKDYLNDNDYIALIERIFTEKLRQKIFVKFKTVKDGIEKENLDDAPVVKSVLDQFGGKVVSKWHNE